MTTYESLGIRPIINAYCHADPSRRFADAARSPPGHERGARCFIDLHELQRRVGDRIAEITHNEAAYVSCGAAAGLVLAAASCIAGS